MSEAQDTKAGSGPSGHSAVDAAAIAGALLRDAREALGLHVSALAMSLKVPVNKLEALEAGRLDLLPDAVFARALASSVCRTLKLDPAPVLQHLPHTAAPRLRTDEAGINTPFRPPGASAALPWWNRLVRPAPLIVLALVLGAIALKVVPQLHWEQAGVEPEPASVAVLPPSGAAPAQNSPATVTPPGATLSAPAPVPAPAAPAASASTVPVPSTAAAPSIVPPAAGPAVIAGSGIIVFQPRGETWVQVTDANGVVALRKTLAAGETAGASGALPLAVVVGRADSTAVEVRGKVFDLAPVSRDNVARFEVK